MTNTCPRYNFRANRMQSNLFELLRCSRKSFPAKNRVGKKVFLPRSLRHKKHASKGKTSGFKKSPHLRFASGSIFFEQTLTNDLHFVG